MVYDTMTKYMDHQQRNKYNLPEVVHSFYDELK